MMLRTALKRDIWYPWTEKSATIPFRSAMKCIGNGELKLASELHISDSPGGQNSTVDLYHEELENISVKDMTKDNCTLGTDGCQRLRYIFRKTVYILIHWCEKYEKELPYAKNILDKLNCSYGRSKFTLLEGIDRFEISEPQLNELNNIIEVVKREIDHEYIRDIHEFLGFSNLKEKCNECVREEAISNTLIIVHEHKGWIILGDCSRLICKRITRGSPRIHFLDV